MPRQPRREDAGPARAEPGQVGADQVLGVGRVGELDPFPGEVQPHLRPERHVTRPRYGTTRGGICSPGLGEGVILRRPTWLGSAGWDDIRGPTREGRLRRPGAPGRARAGVPVRPRVRAGGRPPRPAGPGRRARGRGRWRTPGPGSTGGRGPAASRRSWTGRRRVRRPPGRRRSRCPARAGGLSLRPVPEPAPSRRGAGGGPAPPAPNWSPRRPPPTPARIGVVPRGRGMSRRRHRCAGRTSATPARSAGAGRTRDPADTGAGLRRPDPADTGSHRRGAASDAGMSRTDTGSRLRRPDPATPARGCGRPGSADSGAGLGRLGQPRGMDPGAGLRPPGPAGSDPRGLRSAPGRRTPARGSGGRAPVDSGAGLGRLRGAGHRLAAAAAGRRRLRCGPAAARSVAGRRRGRRSPRPVRRVCDSSAGLGRLGRAETSTRLRPPGGADAGPSRLGQSRVTDSSSGLSRRVTDSSAGLSRLGPPGVANSGAGLSHLGQSGVTDSAAGLCAARSAGRSVTDSSAGLSRLGPPGVTGSGAGLSRLGQPGVADSGARGGGSRRRGSADSGAGLGRLGGSAPAEQAPARGRRRAGATRADLVRPDTAGATALQPRLPDPDEVTDTGARRARSTFRLADRPSRPRTRTPRTGTARSRRWSSSGASSWPRRSPAPRSVSASGWASTGSGRPGRSTPRRRSAPR